MQTEIIDGPLTLKISQLDMLALFLGIWNFKKNYI
jgi:hypothetical protein